MVPSPTMVLRRLDFFKCDAMKYNFLGGFLFDIFNMFEHSLLDDISIAATPSRSPQKKPNDPADPILPSKLWVADWIQKESLHGLSPHEHGPVHQ